MTAADRPCQNIVILTGAGISRESGLETFRDADGIWTKVRLEDVATPEAFARFPERVHRFYNARRRQLVSDAVKPNAAHLALAELEQQWNGRLLLVTQNIDDLHERAGSRHVIHMHGELLKARCNVCSQVTPCRQDLNARMGCPDCGSAGSLRPHVVWFGEVPMSIEEIIDELEQCDLFISIGTSGNVYPAAAFVERARLTGAIVVELNMEPSTNASSFIERNYGPATKIVPGYVHRLLRNHTKRKSKPL
jgi:NAD-dependent protein deacetylase/lipoamidase